MSSSLKTVLLVAYHYPPVQGSSGLQRTLRFSEYLPAYGWRPIVLSIDIRAYEAVSKSAAAPRQVLVYRAFGLDAARQMSVFGRYPRFLALPDRWATWRHRAVPMALKLIRENGVRVVWSTFPIATAHQIGLGIARRSGLPWVAEFRDPMWQGDYPPDPEVNRSWLQLERQVFQTARASVVTTPGAAALYRERYPHFGSSNIHLIENGYDEDSFQQAQSSKADADKGPRPITLLHSGVIYPSERDPTQLFAAIAALKGKGAIDATKLKVLLRASGNDKELARHTSSLGIDDIARLEPPVDYATALREMMSVDGLLILQASNCNAQIPAKIYEYFRARRPILALTDPAGDTAQVLSRTGTGLIAALDNQLAIEHAILDFMGQLRGDTWKRMNDADIARYSRRAQTQQFAELLDSLAGG